MDSVATRFLAEVRARRRVAASANHKAEYDTGYLRGNALYGDKGVPLLKGTRKEKLKLASDRGKTDLDLQKKRGLAYEQGTIDLGQVKPDVGMLPKDDVVSAPVKMRSNSDKFVRGMKLDGGDKWSLPDYATAQEREGFRDAPKCVKPRPNSPFKRARDCSPVIIRK